MNDMYHKLRNMTHLSLCSLHSILKITHHFRTQSQCQQKWRFWWWLPRFPFSTVFWTYTLGMISRNAVRWRGSKAGREAFPFPSSLWLWVIKTNRGGRSIKVSYTLTDPPRWNKAQEMHFHLVQWRFPIYRALIWEGHWLSDLTIMIIQRCW